MHLPSRFSQLHGTSNAIRVVQDRIRGREWILANIDSQGHIYVRYMRCISISRFGGVVICSLSRPDHLFGTITIICGCPGLSHEIQIFTIYGQIWRGQSWTAHMSVMARYSQSILGTEHIPTLNNRFIGIERIYGTCICPVLSIKSENVGIPAADRFLYRQI